MNKDCVGKSKLIKENGILIVGSILVALINLIVMVVYKCAPFGDSLLSSGDNLSQIFPYIEELKDKISSGEALTYSWHSMGGTNFYYLICYTLTSPTMLPLFIVPAKYYAATLNVCIIATAVMMFLAMSYYLTHRVSKARLNKNQPEVLLFGMAYGLLPAFVFMSGFYPYSGVFVLLPFLILGLERFVANLGWRMYFVSLTLIVFMNFYIGAIIIIFTALYYLTLSFKSFREFIIKSVKIIGVSGIAIGVSAVLLIPVIVYSNSIVNSSSEYMGPWFFTDWFEVIGQALMFNDLVESGSVYTEYWQSNLYAGILIELLSLTYFLNKNVRLSTSVRKLVVYAIMLLSVNESTCNYVIHMLHYPISNPNKQVIIILFYMIILAQESFSLYKEKSFVLSKLRLLIPVILMIVVDLGAVVFSSDKSNLNIYLYSFDFIIGYGVLLILKDRFKSKETFAIAMTVILVIEMGWNYTLLFKHSQNDSANLEYDTSSSMWDEVKDSASFYRADFVDEQSLLNKGCTFGVNSMSGVAEKTNEKYLFALNNLGIKARTNALYTSGYNPVLNALFSRKYLIEQDDKASDETYLSRDAMFAQYKLVDSEDGYNLYENDKVLSPVIVAATDMKEYEESNSSSDATGIPNRDLLKCLSGDDGLLTGTQVDLSISKTVNCSAIIHDGAVVITQGKDSEKKEYDSSKTSFVTVGVSVKTSGDYYFDFVDQYHAGFLNAGDKKEYTFGFEPGDFENPFGVESYYFDSYTFDNDRFEDVYANLADRQMKVTEYKSDMLKGTLKSNGDNRVFTTIPYDTAWTVTVDGKEVKTSSIAGAFLSFYVGDGEHEVVLRYKNRGFALGLALSVVFFVIALFMVLYFKKGKYCFWLEKGVYIDEYEYTPGEKSAIAKFLSEALEDDEDEKDDEAGTEENNEKENDVKGEKTKKKSRLMAFLEDDEEEENEENE